MMPVPVVLMLLLIGLTGPPEQLASAGSDEDPPAVAPSVDGAFQERLKALDAGVKGIADLRANFEQHRHTPLLRRPLVSNGTVLAVGDRMRWDTMRPHPSSMLVGEGAVELYYPEDGLIEMYAVDQGFMDLAGVPMPRLAALSKRFEVAPISPLELDPHCNTDRYFAMALTPRTEDLRRYVTGVRMLIDGSRSIATKVVLSGPDGDRTEITFTNIHLNTGVQSDRLKLDVPDGTRRVRPLGTDQDNPGEREESRGETQ
jgi:outer membrane lipoprotein-sorting protein